MELKYRRLDLCEGAAKLLIAPYGIEMLMGTRVYEVKVSFNRTLWNGNEGKYFVTQVGSAFNRTLWNGNIGKILNSQGREVLLIAPYGIEIFERFAIPKIVKYF